MHKTYWLRKQAYWSAFSPLRTIGTIIWKPGYVSRSVMAAKCSQVFLLYFWVLCEISIILRLFLLILQMHNFVVSKITPKHEWVSQGVRDPGNEVGASRLDHGDTRTWKVIELSFRLLFERGKLVSCRKLSILRNTIWWNDNGNYSWWIPHGNDFFISCYYLRVRRESEDFIGFLCNSWFSLIQIIIFTFRRIKRTQWMPFLLTKRTSQLACHAAFS